MKRPRRLSSISTALVLALLGTLLCAAAALAAPASEESGFKRLADRYAPVTMLREQQRPPCETSAEQYQPTSVETVLGNPTVTLTHEGADGDLEDVMKAPSAADIAGKGEGWYLNLEGKALGDTCVYARAFEKLKKEGRAPAVAYAHIAREPGHSGFALQYWFFWYFNQFNDLHEGDWEGMQLTFEAGRPLGALAEDPSEIILFQHAGGERASWEDGKVQKEGTHPIVYPAAGSHATFYDSAIYVENGQQGSGLGCDNTSEPLRELRVAPVLLPERPTDRGKFAWLSYDGRWGEREKGFNNGPTGPQTKTVWKEPFGWMAKQRTTSPRLPGGSVAGPQVSKAFCGAVAAASELINLDAASPPAAVATIVIILLALGLFVGVTRWRPVEVENLRRRRAFGQLLRGARQLYGRNWRLLLGVALAALVVIGGTNFIAGLVADGHSDVAGRSGFNLAGADLLEQLARPIAAALVAAIVIVVVREMDQNERVGFTTATRGVKARFWRVVLAQLGATLGVLLLAITVIGLPWALWKLVGWAFVQQEVLFTDKSLRESFRASSDLVRGRWFRSARVIVIFYVLGIAAGPILSFALIFTALPLIWINLIGSLVYALLIPFVVLGETLLYFDLQVREVEEPAKPRRSWRPWRPRQFGRIAVENGPAPAPSG